MVRQRLEVILVGLGLVLGAGRLVEAQAPSTAPIDQKAYRIGVLVGFDLETRIDATRRGMILEEWGHLIQRFVGEPWRIERVEGLGKFSRLAIEGWKAEDLKGLASGLDKLWVIRGRASGAGHVLEAREFDQSTGWLGEVHRQEVANSIDLARGLLQLSMSVFAPSAEVGESRGGGVSFLVQGRSLPVASSVGEVASVGTIFRVFRLFLKADGSTEEIKEVPYSYFRVQELEGPVARCEIIRGVGDPLTNRYARKNRLVALGIKPSPTPLRLRFVLKPDRQPATGYRLVARTIPPGPRAIEVGTTDRDGRIVLPAGLASGLISLRLLAGNNEPMLEVPVVPGETAEERVLPFEPKPLTLTLEARLEALRDAIVDVVAVRSRLELKMKGRIDSENWDELDQAIAEFRKLTPRDQFQTRLDQIREEAQQQEVQLKTTILTRNALAQLDETKNLIERYLDDDAIRSFEDAAVRARAERVQAKTEKAKAAPRKPASP